MVKSRISAVWPRNSDTRLPERASHNLSFPSKQHVDTTEEDSSHCRWTMPAWRNEDRVVKSGPNVSNQTVKLFLLWHLVLASVPQDVCRQVVYGQGPFKVRHSYERQTGKGKKSGFWLDSQENNILTSKVTRTLQDIHAKKRTTVFFRPHAHVLQNPTDSTELDSSSSLSPFIENDPITFTSTDGNKQINASSSSQAVMPS